MATCLPVQDMLAGVENYTPIHTSHAWLKVHKNKW